MRKGERGGESAGGGERVLASGRVQVLTWSSMHVLQNRGRERLMQSKGRCAPMEERSLADAPAVQPATWTDRFKELVSKFILDPGAPAVREIAHFQSFSLSLSFFLCVCVCVCVSRICNLYFYLGVRGHRRWPVWLLEYLELPTRSVIRLRPVIIKIFNRTLLFTECSRDRPGDP